MIAEESGWKSYKNYERSGSVSRLPISGADLTYQEIRSAASAPSYYPPIHVDPITLTDPHSVNSMPRPYGTPLRNHLISFFLLRGFDISPNYLEFVSYHRSGDKVPRWLQWKPVQQYRKVRQILHTYDILSSFLCSPLLTLIRFRDLDVLVVAVVH